MKIISYTKLMALLMAVVLITACQKNEFMPEPVGEAIAAPNLPLLASVLEGEYSLYKTAWEKAEMDRLLATEQGQAKMTFFIPSNKAMEEAGFTSAKIGASTKEVLQELLRYHVISINVNLERLKMAEADLISPSLLKHPKFLEGMKLDGVLIKTVPYQYEHSITVKDGQLLDNGMAVKINKEAAIGQGTAIFIDRVLKKPEKQMIDVLREDSRFSLYLRAMEISSQGYEDDMLMNWWASFEPPLSYLVDWNFHFAGSLHSNREFPRHVIRFTLFAPTNDAFKQLGIANEADLLALYHRVPAPYMFNTGELTPVDSLLRYQHTGKTYSSMIFNDDYTEFGLAAQRNKTINNVTFYGHMLDDKILANYPIAYGTSNGTDWITAYVPYRFNRQSNHQLTVKHNDSNSQPATVVEENINTIQGPIHVVDRIFVPKDFTMWHKK